MTAPTPMPADGADHRHGFGAWLQRGVIGAGLLVLATSLLAVPLGYAGWWRPWSVVPLLVALAGLIAVLVARLPAARLDVGPAVGLLAVTAATGWWAAATHSTQLLPRRDAGSNVQAAYALADTGHRILAVPAAGIGGPRILEIPGLSIGSAAFYQIGDAASPAIQPQFVIGPAATYSLGRWAGGLDAMLGMPALFGALGVLAVGLLTAIVVGGWWGVVAAGAVAVQFPVLHTARATYSEPLAMVSIGAGFLAWVLAARADHRRTALFAGVLIGGTCLVRIDGLREAILLVPVAALGVIARRAWARPLLLGTGSALMVAFAAAWALSYRYLGDIAGSLVPLIALGVLVLGASLVMIALSRNGFRLPGRIADMLPRVLAGAVLVTGALLAVRPLLTTVRQDPDDPGSHVVAGLQQRQGLPVDGGRTYAEHSVAWLSWWVGPIALAVAIVVLAALAHRLAARWTHGQGLPDWAGPFVVASGSTLLTLYRPGITPDHPWADRRLLIALPFVAVLHLCGAAVLWRSGATWRRRGVAGRGLAGRGSAVVVVAALLIPTAVATWPHRAERVEAGSRAPIEAVCRSLAPGDVVVAVDSRAADEWPQVIRGMCRRPVIAATYALRQRPGDLRAAVAQIDAGLPAGSRVLLFAARSPAAIVELGGTPVRVADSEVWEDQRLLQRRPDALVPLRIDAWTGRLPG